MKRAKITKNRRPNYCFDEKLTVRIKDRRGRVVVELAADTSREYDWAMWLLGEMNKWRWGLAEP